MSQGQKVIGDLELWRLAYALSTYNLETVIFYNFAAISM